MAPERARLVVGLGNPGPRYQATRHNLGFRALDHLVRRLDAHGPHGICRSHVFRADDGERDWILAYPLTFMNGSGEAVACLIRRFAPSLDRVLVVYDDMALAPGRIRVRPSGSSGAHRGMESVIEHLGTDQFARIRIGIGEPPPGTSGVDYVLGVPSGEEATVLAEASRVAAEAAECWGRDGVQAAMNRFNRTGGASAPGGDEGKTARPS